MIPEYRPIKEMRPEYDLAGGERGRYWQRHWAQHAAEPPPGPLPFMIMRAFTEHEQRLKREHLRILDAGCGPGGYVGLFRRAGFDAVGVDWMVQIPPPPHVIRGDITALPFHAETFEGYLSLGAVEHDIRGPYAAIREAVRVLKSGGVAIVSVPAVNHIRELLVSFSSFRQPPHTEFYQYLFRRKSIEWIMRKEGFEIISTTAYDPFRMFRRFVPRTRRRAMSDVQHTQIQTMPWWKRLFYTQPLLHTFGHMWLITARKP